MLLVIALIAKSTPLQLEVKLFERTANRITLTKTGKLAAKKAKQLLYANQRFVEQIQDHAANQKIIKVSATVPGPSFILDQIATDTFALDHELLPTDQITDALDNNKYTLVISEKELQTKTLEARYLGHEDLYVNLDKFTYQANQTSISFSGLFQMSFVALGDIGSWKDTISQHIPDAKFFFQQEYEALKEITDYSSFLYFSTNITHPLETRDHTDRVRLKITDKSARMDLYGIYRKEDRAKVASLLEKISQNWPK